MSSGSATRVLAGRRGEVGAEPVEELAETRRVLLVLLGEEVLEVAERLRGAVPEGDRFLDLEVERHPAVVHAASVLDRDEARGSAGAGRRAGAAPPRSAARRGSPRAPGRSGRGRSSGLRDPGPGPPPPAPRRGRSSRRPRRRFAASRRPARGWRSSRARARRRRPAARRSPARPRSRRRRARPGAAPGTCRRGRRGRPARRRLRPCGPAPKPASASVPSAPGRVKRVGVRNSRTRSHALASSTSPAAAAATARDAASARMAVHVAARAISSATGSSAATASFASARPGFAARPEGAERLRGSLADELLRLVGLAEDERALRLGQGRAHVGRRLPGLPGSCCRSPREGQEDGGRRREDERPKRHPATARSSPRALRPPAIPVPRWRSRAPGPRCRAPRPARARTARRPCSREYRSPTNARRSVSSLPVCSAWAGSTLGRRCSTPA